MASLQNSLWLSNRFLEDVNMFIQILIALGICLTMDSGWLELTLMYLGIALVLLNSLLSFKLKVT